jgi:hypothetical protein
VKLYDGAQDRPLQPACQEIYANQSQDSHMDQEENPPILLDTMDMLPDFGYAPMRKATNGLPRRFQVLENRFFSLPSRHPGRDNGFDPADERFRSLDDPFRKLDAM